VEKEIYRKLSNALVSLDEGEVLALTENAMDLKLNPLDIIEKGLTDGIRRIGDKYASGDLFLPHMVIGADVMEKAVKILEPALKESEQKRVFTGKVVVGTVEGDIHDIGKKILVTLLRAKGYEVIDLGRDVPNQEFVEHVEQERPDFLCLSALMTTTVTSQQAVIEALKKRGLRDRVRVIVGGAAVTPELAEQIGAEGYGESAAKGVELIEEFLIERLVGSQEKDTV
jgi:corrinoid protein of di/trimethylamine methyltransferase